MMRAGLDDALGHAGFNQLRDQFDALRLAAGQRERAVQA